MRNAFLKRIVCSGALFFSACATQTPPATESESFEFLELYLSRGSLSTTEFEQYKISPGGIFIECGELKGGRAIPTSQEFKRYEEGTFSEIRKRAHEALTYLNTHTNSFEPPGKTSSLFDPGQFLLTISFGKEKKEVRTSVNAVSQELDVPTSMIKKLTQAVRKTVNADVCGKASFYGIEVIRS